VNETLPENEPTRNAPAPGLGRMQFRLGALVVIVAIAGIVIWLAVGRNSSSTTSLDTTAVATSPLGLTQLAGALKQPIYWVGERSNVTYEVSRPDNGRILVGYLASGLKVGDRTPHLTVGTYPITDAYSVTRRAASQPGTVKIDVGGGAIAFYNKAYPNSAFVSYPGSSYQIEVFDPTAGGAKKLIENGKVKPVPGSPAETTGAVAVTPSQLAKRAATEHQPIYWAGPAPKGTLELSKTSQRWFLLRYLPPGAEIGTGKGYLTIGTYPITDAYGAVQRLAQEKGARTYNLKDGALAVSNPNHFPYSVFVAYPGSNYQVEVFDPVLARARKVVTSGRITAVG
jgi:hypothetical protein